MPLIVGGGPAGAAAAIRLAQGGLRPVIVERAATPVDLLCGGFLSWNSVALLRECGIDVAALGAHPVDRARLFAGRRSVTLALPARAAGLSRLRLDTALLARAGDVGVDVRRGIAVRSIEGRTLHYADGGSETPERLILATGKHDLRGAARPVTAADPAMGLRWRFPASARLRAAVGDAIELHLFSGGYAGLVLQEDGAANLCLASRHSAFVDAGRSPAAMLAMLMDRVPSLAERMAGEALEDAQAVANVPYGWTAQDAVAGVYRVGDQIGVIPSLAGEGVGIAIATGLAAGDAILNGIGAEAYQASVARDIGRPIGLASRLWHLAERPALASLAMRPIAWMPGLATRVMRGTRVPGQLIPHAA